MLAHAAGPGTGSPGPGRRRAQSHGRLRHRPRRRDHRRGLAPPLRRRSCRGRGPAAGRRPGRRRHAVRHPGALLPHGQDAALHRGRPGRRHPPRGGRHAATRFPRSPAAGWPSSPAAGVDVERGRAGGRGPATQRPLSETLGHRPALDHRQVGHDARRQDRHAHRPEPLDFQPASRGRWSTPCAAGWTPSWSAARRPGATTRC